MTRARFLEADFPTFFWRWAGMGGMAFSRRTFLVRSRLVLAAAPMIVRPSSLMPVRYVLPGDIWTDFDAVTMNHITWWNLRGGPEQKTYGLGYLTTRRDLANDPSAHLRNRRRLESAARQCLDLQITAFDPRLQPMLDHLNGGKIHAAPAGERHPGQ
jgi:hypothetical protein